MEVVGYGMTKDCADRVFVQAGFKEGEGRDQVGVVELHDCFAANEVGDEAVRACGYSQAPLAHHISGPRALWSRRGS